MNDRISVRLKDTLKNTLLASLDGEIAAAIDAARQAQETASHEDNKPENQYDTLALEAAYLAHGQSERIRDLQETRIRIAQWPLPDFCADDAITTGALIQLANAGGGERWLWIAPVGGRQLQVDDKTVQVISPQAPLAVMLRQMGVGDEVSLGHDSGWEIVQLY